MMTALPAPSSALGVGIHDGVPMADYLRDPAPEPSLSASIAKLLVDASARHAWLAHPRLGGDPNARTGRAFDLGTAAHSILLEGSEACIAPVDADSYRTKAAQEVRDAAYAAGRTPLLPDQLETVRDMVGAARAQLARHLEASEAFNPLLGRSERTMVWREDDVWCRARADWMPANGNVLYDYKTTTSAHPDEFVKRAYNVGHDVQAALYRRGLRILTGREWHFRWVVQEVEPPYALSVCELDPASIAMAERKVEAAVGYWRWCVANDRWPGYPNRVAYLTAPAWEERQWLEREDRARLMADANEDERAFALNWQAPLAAPKEAA